MHFFSFVYVLVVSSVTNIFIIDNVVCGNKGSSLLIMWSLGIREACFRSLK